MKKIFTVLFLAMCVWSTANAQLWLEENFNYPVGNLEQVASNAELIEHVWMPSMKAADANGVSPQVAEGALTYAGYASSGKGKKVVLDAKIGDANDSQRISVYYMDTLGKRDTVSMYAAFLFKPLSAKNTSGRDFAIWEGSVSSSMARGRVFLAKSGSMVKVGVSKNSSTISAWTNDLAIGETHLLVMKYEVVPGEKNDIIKVFVNPTLNTAESANTYIATSDAATDMIVRGFGLRQRGTGMEVSGLRIGTTWEEVMGMSANALFLEGSFPAPNSYVDPTTTQLTLTFNEEVALGTSNGVPTLTSIGGETKMLTPSIAGKVVTLPVVLEAEKDYRLSIPAGVFASGSAENMAIDIDFTTRNPNVYIVEDFAYLTGEPVEGNNGWVVSTSTADQGGISPVVADTLLTYAGYGNSAEGQSMVLDSVAQGISGDLKRNTVLPFTLDKVSVDAGSNVVYTAFLVNLSTMGSTSGKELFGYLKQGAENGANTTMRGRVQVKIEKNKMVFGIRKNSQEITQWSDSLDKNETALLVVKYINNSTSSSNTADEFFLYVNPDASKSEAENSALMQVAVGNDVDGGADLRAICFRQMKLNAYVGGIRVAKTWEDALNNADTLNTEDIESIEATRPSASKVIVNGNLYILRDGKVYTIGGVRVQ